MLSRSEIEAVIASGELKFNGVIRGTSLLLTLGKTILPFSEPLIIKPWEAHSVNSAYISPIKGWTEFDLKPGQIILCSAEEQIALSVGLAAQIGTLSHMARLGLFTHVASPFVDPGFDGAITFELFNCSPHTIRLRAAMPVAKLFLFSLSAEEGNRRAIHYGNEDELGSQYFEEFRAYLDEDE